MLREVAAADKLSGGALSEGSLAIAKVIVAILMMCIPAMIVFMPLDVAPNLEKYVQKNPNSFRGTVAKIYKATIPQKAVDIWASLPPVKRKGYEIDWVLGAYYFLAGWLIIAIGTALLLGLGFLLATRCSGILKTSPRILLWTPLLAGVIYLAIPFYLGAAAATAAR